MYKIRVKRESELQVAEWQGGTTTEIAIYPEESQYSARNFKWRVSTAKVNVEESTFTDLPNYNRIIMPLNGELELQHDNNRTVYIEKYQDYSFNGSWLTKSKGKVQDFNLMYNDDCEGELRVQEIAGHRLQDIKLKFNDFNYKSISYVFYCYEGKVEMNFIGSEPITLHEGDVIVIHLNELNDELNIVVRNFLLKNSILINTIIKHD